MNHMFAACKSLDVLDITTFDTSNVTQMRGMFTSSTKLKTIIVGDGWNGDKVTFKSDGSTATEVDFLPSFSDNCQFKRLEDGKILSGSITENSGPSGVFANGAGTWERQKVTMSLYSTADEDDLPDNGVYVYKIYDYEVPMKDTIFDGHKVAGTVITRSTLSATLFNSSIPKAQVSKITFVDQVSAPVSLSSWFSGLTNCTDIDATTVDFSTCTSFLRAFNSCPSLVNIIFPDDIDASNVDSTSYMFSGCTSLTSFSCNWNFSNVTNMSYMFSGCSSLETVAFRRSDSGDSTVEEIDMRSVFYNCSALQEVDLSGFGVSDQTIDMGSMFSGCSNLERISLFPPSAKISSGVTAFRNCTALEEADLSNLDTSEVISLANMFYGCSRLKKIIVGEGWNVEHSPTSTNFLPSNKDRFENAETGEIFYGSPVLFPSGAATYVKLNKAYAAYCLESDGQSHGLYFYQGDPDGNIPETSTVLDDGRVVEYVYPNIELSMSVQNAHQNAISKVEVVDKGIRPTTMASWFYSFVNCTEMNLGKLDTSLVTSMASLFSGCTSLKELDLSNFDTGKVTNMSYMFRTCSALVKITVGEQWNIDSSSTSTGFLPTGASFVRDDDDSITYSSNTLFPNGAGTYEKLKQAFAIWSSIEDGGDNTLRFYKDYSAPVTGTTYRGQYVSNRYTTVESVSVNSPWSAICANIETAIVVDEGIKPVSMSRWFYNATALETVDLRNLNTSKVTTMYQMFYKCTNLTSVDLSELDASQVTTMQSMFYDCSNLIEIKMPTSDNPNLSMIKWIFNGAGIESIDLSGFDTSQVENMAYMFQNCSNLKKADLTPLDTSNVTDMTGVFANCTSLVSADISGCDTSKVTVMGNLFANCAELKTIFANSSFSTASVETNYTMFTDDNNLTGGMGSTFAEYAKDGYAYARIDGGSSAPGYFTPKFDMSYYDLDGNLLKSIPYEYGITLSDLLEASGVDLEEMTDPTKSYTWSSQPNEKGTQYNLNDYMTYDYSNPYVPVSLYLTEAKTSFAIYSEDDNSLCFYKRDEVPAVGDTFNGNTVSMVFKDIETREGRPEWQSPGSNRANSISYVDIVDKIAPSSTYCWFAGFRGCSEIRNIANLDTSDITNMASMFDNCWELKELDVSNFNTSKVTDMSRLFFSCYSLTNIDVSNFDTSNVISMFGMFYQCSLIENLDLTGFDTSKVTDMSLMFFYDSHLNNLDLSHFNTAEVTDMSYMFTHCVAPISFSTDFDTANVTNMSAMFASYGGTSLDLSNFDTSNVTDMSSMFAGLTGLSELDLSSFDTSKVTNMSNMFEDHTNTSRMSTRPLIKIIIGPNWKTSQIEDIEEKTANFLSTTFVNESDHSKTYIGDAAFPDGAATYLKSWGYAIFSSSEDGGDDSFSFYNGIVPDPDDETYNGKPISQIFHNIERQSYYQYPEWNESSWTNTVVSIEIVDDGITPDSTRAWFRNFNKCQSISGLSKLDTSNVKDMSDMFYWCYTLTKLDLSGFDTSNVTNMTRMFYYCKELKTIVVGDNWNVDSVTSYSSFLSSASTASYVSDSDTETTYFGSNLFPTGKATYLKYCRFAVYSSSDDGGDDSFRIYQRGLPDVDYYDTYDGKPLTRLFEIPTNNNPLWSSGQDNLNLIQRVKAIEIVDNISTTSTRMWFDYFKNCTEIIGIDKIDTSQATSFESMFSGCSNLEKIDISGLDTTSLKYASYMFKGCSKLSELVLPSNFITSTVTNMSSTFENCIALTEIDSSKWNTSNVTTMSAAFKNCAALKVFDASSFNTSSLNNASNMFNGCENLSTIYASSSFSVSQASNHFDMFSGCNALVGGLGTSCKEESPTDGEYARIDGGEDSPGYFTPKFYVYYFDASNHYLGEGALFAYGLKSMTSEDAGMIKLLSWEGSKGEVISIKPGENVVYDPAKLPTSGKLYLYPVIDTKPYHEFVNNDGDTEFLPLDEIEQKFDNEGGKLILGEDDDSTPPDESIVIKTNVIIDLNGHDLTSEDRTPDVPFITVIDGGELTITDTSTGTEPDHQIIPETEPTGYSEAPQDASFIIDEFGGKTVTFYTAPLMQNKTAKPEVIKNTADLTDLGAVEITTSRDIDTAPCVVSVLAGGRLNFENGRITSQGGKGIVVGSDNPSSSAVFSMTGGYLVGSHSRFYGEGEAIAAYGIGAEANVTGGYIVVNGYDKYARDPLSGSVTLLVDGTSIGSSSPAFGATLNASIERIQPDAVPCSTNMSTTTLTNVPASMEPYYQWYHGETATAPGNSAFISSFGAELDEEDTEASSSKQKLGAISATNQAHLNISSPTIVASNYQNDPDSTNSVAGVYIEGITDATGETSDSNLNGALITCNHNLGVAGYDIDPDTNELTETLPSTGGLAVAKGWLDVNVTGDTAITCNYTRGTGAGVYLNSDHAYFTNVYVLSNIAEGLHAPDASDPDVEAKISDATGSGVFVAGGINGFGTTDSSTNPVFAVIHNESINGFGGFGVEANTSTRLNGTVVIDENIAHGDSGRILQSNAYMNNDLVLHICGDLKDGSSIGITEQNPPSIEDGILRNGFAIQRTSNTIVEKEEATGGDYEGYDTQKQFFFSDVDGYRISTIPKYGQYVLELEEINENDLYGPPVAKDPNMVMFQYFAWMETAETINTGDKLSMVNTKSDSPLNGKGTSANPVENGAKFVNLNLTEEGFVRFDAKLTRMYAEDQQPLSVVEAGTLEDFNKFDLQDLDGYNIAEVWVLKPGKHNMSGNNASKASIDQSDFYVYEYDPISHPLRLEYSDNPQNETMLDADVIQYNKDTVIRFVVDSFTKTSSYGSKFFDYDISDGNAYASASDALMLRNPLTSAQRQQAVKDNTPMYINTRSQGINAFAAGQSGSVFAFGNANSGTKLDQIKWNSKKYLPNKWNGGTYAGCTFGLVGGVGASLSQDDDKVPVFNNIATTDLFSDRDSKDGVKGKTSFVNGEYSLVFKARGNVFTLASVKKAGDENNDDANKTCSSLNVFGHPGKWNGTNGNRAIWTNDFWPMDMSETWGADGHDIVFGATSKKDQRGFTDDNGKGVPMPLGDDDKDHNCFFGMNFDTEFTIPDDYVGPLSFYFFGDDDLWVYLDDKLVGDLGGIHSSAGYYIDLWKYINNNTRASNNTHTMKVFYDERGASGSTCWMQLVAPNMTSITYDNELSLTKVSSTDGSIVLPGAEFTLYESLTPNAEGELDAAQTVITDENGQATFTHLIPGTYYLKETATPIGYNDNDRAYKVVITNGEEPQILPFDAGLGEIIEDVIDGALGQAPTIKPGETGQWIVTNVPTSFSLPQTGKGGILIASIVALLIVVASSVFVARNFKSRKEQPVAANNRNSNKPRSTKT